MAMFGEMGMDFANRVINCPICAEPTARQDKDFWLCPTCGCEIWPPEPKKTRKPQPTPPKEAKPTSRTYKDGDTWVLGKLNTHTPAKEPILQMPGKIQPGKGSKSGRKRKKPPRRAGMYNARYRPE